jgi:Xaa-Pro aminopeptidase
MKSGLPSVLTIPAFLADLAVKHYREHQKPLRVGMDPYVHSASFCKELQDAFKNAALQELNLENDEVIGVLDTSHPNLIDPIWGSERPPIPTSPFRIHPLEYAGMSALDKVVKIRKEMEQKNATLAVFCTLDDVAYLFNLRAMGDVETCPVGIAYATVSLDEITLYCDSAKVQSPELQEYLREVKIKPYDSVVDDIRLHCHDSGHCKVWIDKSRANFALSNVIPDKCLLDLQNAITPMKACKNDAEMQGMRQAHLVDGAAMAHFMAWLEDCITVQEQAISEVTIDLKLTAYRAQQPGFLEVSFPTIAGVGSNGAIIHYRAKEGTDLLKYLDKSNPILIDSGAQYTYGTTDVTRTWHFGTPTPEFVDAYTRVLKGNIGVDQMVFPENTPGFVLDVLARRSLWDVEKDYGHGTGHGVGAALNVHEGPHSISPRWTNKEVLKKGMVVSNEPGYYEDGNFGVRIENLLEIRYVKPEYNNEESANGSEATSKSTERKFLRMEKLTMIPIQKNLINLQLMSDEELDWLDDYHQTVLEKVGPLLEPNSAAMAWLRKSCEKIDRLGH